MQMYVQVQGRTEALNQSDCASAGARGHGKTRVPDQERRDTALHHCQHLCQGSRLSSEQEAQREWKGQNKLPDWNFGKHVVDKVCGRFDHASCAAAGTEAAPLATERDQVLVPTA